MRVKRFFRVPLLFILAILFICLPDVCFGGGGSAPPPPALEIPTQAVVRGVFQLEEDTKWKKILDNEMTMIKDLVIVTAADFITLKNMQRDSERYGDDNDIIGAALISIAQLLDGYADMRSTVGSLANMDSNFRKLFFTLLEKDASGSLVERRKWNDDAWIKNYSLRYRQLNDEIENHFRSTLGVVGAVKDHIMTVAYNENDNATLRTAKEKIMNALVKVSKDPSGRNQILQIRNELLTFMTGELMEIQAVMMMQFNDYESYVMQRESNRKAFSKGMDVDLSAWPVSKSSPKSYTGRLGEDQVTSKK